MTKTNWISLILILFSLTHEPRLQADEWFEWNATQCRREAKRFPAIRRPGEAFSSKMDCSANDIQLPEDRLKQNWGPFLNQENQIKFSDQLDLQAAFELNIKAALLWQEILKDSQSDAEKARETYWKNRFPQPLKNSTTELRAQVYQFLQSGEFKDPGEPGWNRDIQLPEMHPLFVQFVLEALSSAKIYHRLDTRYWRDGYQLNHAFDDGSFNYTLLYRGIFLLGRMPLKVCSEWGIYPRAARGIAYAMHEISSFMAIDNGGVMSLPSQILDRPRGLIEKVCGIAYYFQDKPNPYSNEPEYFVNEYRKRFRIK